MGAGGLGSTPLSHHCKCGRYKAGSREGKCWSSLGFSFPPQTPRAAASMRPGHHGGHCHPFPAQAVFGVFQGALMCLCGFPTRVIQSSAGPWCPCGHPGGLLACIQCPHPTLSHSNSFPLLKELQQQHDRTVFALC